jgi:hypothetical protein
LTAEYKLLSAEERVKVRELINTRHGYFFHGTTRSRLEGIRRQGLDPAFEHEESEYFWQRLEPDKAMRFCAKTQLKSACETAEERARWRDGADPSKFDPNDIVLLRVRAAALLEKSFGLDHAYIDAPTTQMALDANGMFPAEKFFELFDNSGMISCYDIILPPQLEIYTGSFYNEHAALKKELFSPL